MIVSMDTEAPETDPEEQGLGPRRSGSPNRLNLVPHHSCTALTRATDKTTTSWRINCVWWPHREDGLKNTGQCAPSTAAKQNR